MAVELHPILRALHIVLGFSGFLTGAAAILLPKFSRKSGWHRWVGRGYAVSMIGMAVLSIPLSIWMESILLLVIGIVTLLWVVGGWVAMRRVKRSQPGGRRVSPSGRLRWHITWMGSSYVAAWTAFLVNVEPLGGSLAWTLVYSIAPTVIGSLLIGRTIARLSNPARRQAERLSREST